MATNKIEHKYKVGDILASWGYSHGWVNYYQIVKVTPKTVSFRQIKTEIVSTDKYGQSGWVRPVKDVFVKGVFNITTPITKKVDVQGNVKVGPYSYAHLWNGENDYFDTYD